MSHSLSLAYFHNFTNYEEIRKTFLPYVHKDGYFLLRNSISGSHYCISVIHNQEIKHMRIDQRDGTFILQDKPFPSIDKLVKHYKKHEIENEERIRHIRLLFPIKHGNSTVPGESTRRASDSQLSSGSPELPGRMAVRAASMPSKRDSKSKVKAAEKGRSSLPITIASRPPAALPRGILRTPVEPAADAYSRPPPEYCYDYAKLTDHIQEVKESVRLMDLEDQLCQCGLLISASMLPMGWTVHLSTEPGTDGRVFFVSPNQLSAWDLPSEVDTLLTAEQRFFIAGLRQNAN